MKVIKNILVVVDPTASLHPCIDKAAILAKACGAGLELFSCDTKIAQAARAAVQLNADPEQSTVTALRSTLELLAKPLRAAGLEVATAALCAEPLYAALLAHAKNSNANLVIKDTHHHSLAKRTFITNTDWQLIRGCPVPLLLTKAAPWNAKLTIVAALDPGHVDDKPAQLDQQLLSWADALHAHLKGSVHVAHAFIPEILVAAAMGGGPNMVVPMLDESIKAESAAKLAMLKSLTKSFDIESKNIHMEMGSPMEVLLRIVERLDADILVTGAVSRSGIKRIFVGSTAEQILERVPCDILVVKPPNFSEDLPF